jgi:hypothetical protein
MFRSILPLATFLCVVTTPALAETLDPEGAAATGELSTIAEAPAIEEEAEKRRKGKKRRKKKRG